jgi:uncharacterized membrane protein
MSSDETLDTRRTNGSRRMVTNALTNARWYGEAGEGSDGIEDFSPRRRAFNALVTGAVDGTLDGLRRHWLGIVNGTLIAFVGLAVLAPIGLSLGITGPSTAIFDAYRIFCAQTPSHSLFIGGYQMCLCSRCLAIYSSVLLGGLLLALVRGQRDVRALDWRFWLLAMVPMALDGGTQLFGWRESNLGLRLLTGVIFGLATAWFMLPQIENASGPRPAEQTAIAGIAGRERRD